MQVQQSKERAELVAAAQGRLDATAADRFVPKVSGFSAISKAIPVAGAAPAGDG